MTEMTIKNAAKINLSLDVTGRLPNGYHTIESIFRTVGIFDETTVSLTDSGITLSCETSDALAGTDEIPCDERNTAYKAAKLYLEKTNAKCGCRIHIKKNIPSQAGLGGGSSDAAAVLWILSRLLIDWKSPMTRETLAEMGASVGADVPFFFTESGTAYVSGIGEKITPIENYYGLPYLVIAKGSDGVSTAEAYKKIDSLADPVHPQTRQLLNAVRSGEPDEHRFFGNIFEEAVQLESVSIIKKIMTEYGSLKSVMTGSGSAVFGVFRSDAEAEKCEERLKNYGFFAQKCMSGCRTFLH